MGRAVENLETVGSTGINSCSPVGPAGYTGCLSKVIQEARGERKRRRRTKSAAITPSSKDGFAVHARLVTPRMMWPGTPD